MKYQLPEPEKILNDVNPESVQELVDLCLSSLPGPERSPGRLWMWSNSHGTRFINRAIEDLAQLGYVAIARNERTTKHNDLIAIETWEPRRLLQAASYASGRFNAVLQRKRSFDFWRGSELRRWINDMERLGVDVTKISSKAGDYDNANSPAHAALQEAITKHTAWVTEIRDQNHNSN